MTRVRSPSLLDEVLGRVLEDSVSVRLKDGKEVRGRLRAYDPHVNLALEGAEEVEDGRASRRYGRLVLRGDNVIYVSHGQREVRANI